MRTALSAVLVVSSIVLLSGCETETRQSTHRPPGHPVGNPKVMPSPTPAIGVPNTSPTPSPTPATTSSAATGNIPYGIPVPGKPGFVTSPFSPGAGYIDVRGFPPNSEAKDPYTGKIFRVP
ncbi:MAG TPA: hypothetical protein VIM48_07990 [Chthoniobacterales bacterium]